MIPLACIVLAATLRTPGPGVELPALLAAPARVVFAHGLGDGAVLPVPFPLVLLGAGGSLVGLAAALTSRGTTARLRPAVSDPDSSEAAPALADLGRGQTALLRAVGLAILAGVLALAVAGPEDPAVNPAHRLVFGLLWPLVVPVAALLGGFGRLLSPLRALGGGLLRLVDPQEAGVAPLPHWGVWPAAAGLVLIVWLEMALPADPALLALAVAGYLLVHLAATLRYGTSWLACGEAVEVATDLVGRLSPLRRSDDGRMVLRSPRGALAAPAPPGTLGVVAVLVGGHLFDFLADTGRWGLLESLREGAALVGLRTVGLLACIAGVAVLIRAAARLRVLISALLPLVPGYALAHHTPVVLIDGQAALRQLATLGTRAVADYELLPVVPVATFILVTFVAAHLLAVRTGHDVAFARFDPRGARAVQFPLRAVLLASLSGGLALRFLP